MSYTTTAAYSPSSHKPPISLNGLIADSQNEIFGIGDDYYTVTPTIFSGLTLGNGTMQVYGHRVNGRMSIYGRIVLGSTSSVSGNIVIRDLTPRPHTGLYSYCPAQVILKTGSRWRIGAGWADSFLTNPALTISAGEGNNMNATTPDTWTTGDEIIWAMDQRQGGKVTTLR